MSHTIARLLTIGICVVALSGCTAVALGTAGGVTATEIEEDAGEFDPLEGTEAGQELSDIVN